MSRISNIDKLRAFAAFLVLYFHATNTVDNYPINPFIRDSGKYGHYGVEIFFVISGFIIPYSMWMAGYIFKTDVRKFIYKRLLRVEPPYIASIIFAIVIGLVANIVYGKSLYVFTFPQVASHFLYLTNFLGYEWVNPVYWTLAIEFQFYFSLAILYPLIMNPAHRVGVFGVIAVVFLASGEWANGTLIFYIPLFAMGLTVALVKMDSITMRGAFMSLAVCFLGGMFKLNPIAALLGLMTSVILITGKNIPNIPGLQFIGVISYSIYLFHYPIVEKLIRFLKVLGYSISMQLFAIILTLLLGTFVSWLAYILVERPSILAAGRIRYSR